MIVNLYSLYDAVGETFGNVTMERNDGLARRNFASAMAESTQLQFISKDMILYRVGQFDLENGSVIPCVPMVLVCKGIEVMPRDDS